jgi:hypothetical protein
MKQQLLVKKQSLHIAMITGVYAPFLESPDR